MRLAVTADIHGNLPALEAVAADIAARGIDDVIDLGDIVSGPLWPRDTLELVRRLGWRGVRGNHDRCVGLGPRAALSRTDAFAADDLSEADRGWLACLPPTLQPLAGVLATHARPGDDAAYLLEDVDGGRLVPATAAAVTERLGACAAALVLTGHSHQPALRRLPGGTWIVNPGSVGCPAYHDPDDPAHASETGSPAARYAVLTLGAPGREGGLVKAELIALPYDYPSAVRRALTHERPDWAHALEHGTCRTRG